MSQPRGHRRVPSGTQSPRGRLRRGPAGL